MFMKPKNETGEASITNGKDRIGKIAEPTV
jgi:hypothetical protein